MDKNISFTQEEINVLRGSLKAIEEILNSKGLDGSSIDTAPIHKPKESKADKVKKYANQISTRKRATKPDHLKKKKP